MNTRDLLESDKERIYARLSQTDTADRAVDVLEDELSRILLRYNESCTDSQLSEQAAYSIQTARAALALVDSAGEIKAYERTAASGKSPAKYAGPMAIGAGTAIASGLILTMAPAVLAPLGFICLAAGVVSAFIGGMNYGKSRGSKARPDQYLEATLDHDKIYRNLWTTMTVIDQTLDDVRLRQQAALQAPETPGTVTADMPEDELRLLTGLLETAYSQKDQPSSQTVISDIKYYLHRKNIEVVEYSEETAKYFTRMPSSRTGTLRPALLKNGLPIQKGVAAAGRQQESSAFRHEE